MSSSNDGNTPVFPPNAFTSTFLRRFDDHDEPITAAEADFAGPWSIEEIPGRGFGLFRTGESHARGFHPTAVFTTRWLAIVVAAILPGVGRDPYLSLEKDAGPEGYAVLLHGLHGRAPGGKVVGHLPRFDEPLIDAANGALFLLRSPESLAWLLEAAGSICLARCGAILDARVPETPPDFL
jgi:hypothetical protein